MLFLIIEHNTKFNDLHFFFFIYKILCGKIEIKYIPDFKLSSMNINCIAKKFTERKFCFYDVSVFQRKIFLLVCVKCRCFD